VRVIFGKSKWATRSIRSRSWPSGETGQLVIEDCVALSHRISDRIDALEEAGETLIEEAYRLEVSSPGIDRPLTRPRILPVGGHEAKVNLTAPVDGNRKGFRATLPGWRAKHPARRQNRPVSFPLPISFRQAGPTDKLLAATKPIDSGLRRDRRYH
jgi:ribosome maturation factor RimP